MKLNPFHDLIEGPNQSLILRVSLPGFSKNQIKLTYKNNAIKLEAYREAIDAEKALRLSIPNKLEGYWDIDPTLKLDMANLQDGILEIMFSKRIPLPIDDGVIEIQ